MIGKMTIKADVPAVFRNAIAEGRFIDDDHASDYMYMYTDGDGVDQFKHIDSRQYLKAASALHEEVIEARRLLEQAEDTYWRLRDLSIDSLIEEYPDNGRHESLIERIDLTIVGLQQVGVPHRA